MTSNVPTDSVSERSTRGTSGSLSAGTPIDSREVEGGLVWTKRTASGVEDVLLTNFTARITANIVRDNGEEREHLVEITARLGDGEETFCLPAKEFLRMEWPMAYLGGGAILHAGTGIKDRARVGIQVLSGQPPTRRVFTHLGWTQVDGDWVFLHAGGAIDRWGTRTDIEVRPPDDLRGFSLPDPPEGEELRKCVRASLRMLEVMPERVTLPLHATIWRAVYGDVDFSIWIDGPSGSGKSELAALAQQHFGAEMHAKHLPANWSSTENQLEMLAFYAKDALLTVDDFRPATSRSEEALLRAKAERVLRAQGNVAGRGRLDPEAGLTASKPPRGLMVSTGEVAPVGQSLVARTVVLHTYEYDMNWEFLTKLQRAATRGMFARALAGFVRYLASDYGAMKEDFGQAVRQRREQYLGHGTHNRAPSNFANLYEALNAFFNFAIWPVEALHPDEAEALLDRLEQTFVTLAETESEQQAANDPVTLYFGYLAEAISDGMAHIAGCDGEPPPQPSPWGWRVEQHRDREPKWRPSGTRIGWTVGEDLYLDPTAAYGTARSIAIRSGQEQDFRIGRTNLTRALDRRRLLVASEPGGYTYRKMAERDGERQRLPVLWLRVESLAKWLNGVVPYGTREEVLREERDERSSEEILPSCRQLVA